MTLPVYPLPISASQINVELGKASNSTFSINASDSRQLAGILGPDTTIKYSDFHGKSREILPSGGVVNIYSNSSDSCPESSPNSDGPLVLSFDSQTIQSGTLIFDYYVKANCRAENCALADSHAVSEVKIGGSSVFLKEVYNTAEASGVPGEPCPPPDNPGSIEDSGTASIPLGNINVNTIVIYVNSSANSSCGDYCGDGGSEICMGSAVAQSSVCNVRIVPN